jgi:diazepam-binding inhibitor (GABA receptor modulator, acyl-CoA-binding protein)
MNNVFYESTQRVKALDYISKEHQLMLYGLYKQATVGDCSIFRPSLFNPRDRAKWDAWNKKRGMLPDAAKAEYVQYVNNIE